MNDRKKLYEITIQVDRGDAFENAANPWIEEQIVCKHHLDMYDLENDEDVIHIEMVSHGECGYCKMDNAPL